MNSLNINIQANLMKKTYEILEYTSIKTMMKEYAMSNQAKKQIDTLVPYLSELELKSAINDTTQARNMLDNIGLPPIPITDNIEEYVDYAVKGEYLAPEDIEKVGFFLVSIKRLKAYLEKGKENMIGLAYYCDNLEYNYVLYEEIERSIRGGRIDDYASTNLRDIRHEIQLLEDKIKLKAESILKANKSYVSEAFVVNRNGRVCIPVRKECKSKIRGAIIDKSATGSTLFIEPEQLSKLRDEYDIYKIEEDCEERKIIYQLMNGIAECEEEFKENIRVIVKLDFIFAKGKLSAAMDAVEPNINTQRYIILKKARHPMIPKTECVPLDFIIGRNSNDNAIKDKQELITDIINYNSIKVNTEKRGMIITGPNTGGKTVSIKTVGLLSIMACSGLHIPCTYADIAMNSLVLCDIGDGQNISDNLSTFSSHISNILNILESINDESLVIIDELGSGTDPAEGMGIAIAILEQLRNSGCLFLVTTHYPEVKEYAKKHSEIENARMTFDKETLKPLYRLEIGKAGDSCALYIAKKLGIPDEMLEVAANAAYGDNTKSEIESEFLFGKNKGQRINKIQKVKKEATHGYEYKRGDCVTIMPEGKLAIVVKSADKDGNLMIQIKKEKIKINHKRLKLKVAAEQLYPEDYDFSIIFDTVANRKARHKMNKGYRGDLIVEMEEDIDE